MFRRDYAENVSAKFRRLEHRHQFAIPAMKRPHDEKAASIARRRPDGIVRRRGNPLSDSLLAMPDFTAHFAFFSPDFAPAFARFLNAHARLIPSLCDYFVLEGPGTLAGCCKSFKRRPAENHGAMDGCRTGTAPHSAPENAPLVSKGFQAIEWAAQDSNL